MKTIYFVFLAVYILGSVFGCIHAYLSNYKSKADVYEVLTIVTFVGGFIFCFWAIAMWANNLW